jgi:hypothetical protein
MGNWAVPRLFRYKVSLLTCGLINNGSELVLRRRSQQEINAWWLYYKRPILVSVLLTLKRQHQAGQESSMSS